MQGAPKHTTAILYFARSANAEVRFKELSRNGLSNRNLINALSRHSLEVALDSGFPLFHFDEKKQSGASFGDRLISSVRKVADHGFHKVIVIGGDCPQLAVSDIHQADEALKKTGMVIGPDKRGGVYLLGIDLQQCSIARFSTLHWQQTSFVTSIKALAANEKTNIEYLEPKADLNCESDVYRQKRSSAFLKKLLWLFKFCSCNRGELLVTIYAFFLFAKQYRRGPPFLSSQY